MSRLLNSYHWKGITEASHENQKNFSLVYRAITTELIIIPT